MLLPFDPDSSEDLLTSFLPGYGEAEGNVFGTLCTFVYSIVAPINLNRFSYLGQQIHNGKDDELYKFYQKRLRNRFIYRFIYISKLFRTIDPSKLI